MATINKGACLTEVQEIREQIQRWCEHGGWRNIQGYGGPPWCPLYLSDVAKDWDARGDANWRQKARF
jgi:hypothetical protein